MSDEKDRQIVRKVVAEVIPVPPKSLVLNEDTILDLTKVDSEEAKALAALHNKLAIERHDHRQRTRDDVVVTKAKLETYTSVANATQAEGGSITITNVTDDSLGRTEVIVGNTDAARKGKLSRSQAGLPDTAKLWLVFAGIVAAVVVLISALRR